MLLEQFQQQSEKAVETSPLLQFVLNDKEDVSAIYQNFDYPPESPREEQKFQDIELVRKCLEAVKLKCKQSLIWQKEASRLKQFTKKLQENNMHVCLSRM